MSRFLTLLVLVAVSVSGCSNSTMPGSDAAADAAGDAVVDATPDGAADATADAATCAPVACTLACEFGFVRGPDGCELCECAPEPDASCTDDSDCVLARNVTGCCGCEQAHPRTRVDSETCLVERGEAPVAGCLPDPEVCAVIDCAACEPVVRALCDGGTCAGSDTCGADDVVFRLGCVPRCGGHGDCTLAADYGSCCGGCSAVPTAFDEADACWAERQSDSDCAPAPGSCDDLGCPSPATDCTLFGGRAMCMEDGSCRQTDGGCPTGFSDVGGVCVAD